MGILLRDIPHCTPRQWRGVSLVTGNARPTETTPHVQANLTRIRLPRIAFEKDRVSLLTCLRPSAASGASTNGLIARRSRLRGAESQDESRMKLRTTGITPPVIIIVGAVGQIKRGGGLNRGAKVSGELTA